MFQKLLAKPLPPDQVKALVEQETSHILRVCQPHKIFLFGSAARLEMTEASDLDFLVIMPDGTNLKTVKQAYYCTKRDRNCPVDIVFLEQSDFETKSKVGGVAMICLHEGRVVYEAEV